MFGFPPTSPRRMENLNNLLLFRRAEILKKMKKKMFKNKMETYRLKMRKLNASTKKTKKTSKGQVITQMNNRNNQKLKRLNLMFLGINTGYSIKIVETHLKMGKNKIIRTKKLDQ